MLCNDQPVSIISSSMAYACTILNDLPDLLGCDHAPFHSSHMLLVLQGGCQGAEQAAGTFYFRRSQEGVQFKIQVGAQPGNPPRKFGSHQVSCPPESMHHRGQFVYLHKPLVTR